MKNPDTLFIIDPTCLLTFGHNREQIKTFATFFKDHSKVVNAVIPKFYPMDILGPANDFRILGRLYEPHLMGSRGGVLSKLYVGLRKYAKSKNPFFKILYSPLFNVFKLLLHFVALFSANSSMNKIIKICESKSDSYQLFFINSDYYFLHALRKNLNKLALSHKNTAIKIRMIGVMEDAPYLDLSKGHYIKILRELSKNKFVSVMAESISYAQHLSSKLGIKVKVCPIPQTIMPSHHAQRWSGRQVVRLAFPGAGRRDKGYFQILDIIDEIQKIFSKTGRQFLALVQSMPITQPEYRWDYQRLLAEHPNVQLLPAIVDHDSIRKVYRDADLVVLPYDRHTYSLRSSAVLYEAASFGKPVIAYQGCAFTKELELFSLGSIATDKDDSARLIVKMLQNGSQENSQNNSAVFIEWITNSCTEALIGE